MSEVTPISAALAELIAELSPFEAGTVTEAMARTADSPLSEAERFEIARRRPLASVEFRVRAIRKAGR